MVTEIGNSLHDGISFKEAVILPEFFESDSRDHMTRNNHYNNRNGNNAPTGLTRKG